MLPTKCQPNYQYPRCATNGPRLGTKYGKPRGYLLDLVTYYGMPRAYCGCARDRKLTTDFLTDSDNTEAD